MKWFKESEVIAQEKRFNENLHTMIELKNVEIEGLRQQLQEARKDRDFYREELFKLKGIGTQPIQENAKEEPELQPMTRTREPWPLRQRRLEREDRERLAEAQKTAQAQVESTEDYWKKKNLTSELNEAAKKVN